jgi:putative phosphoribosyl transferase
MKTQFFDRSDAGELLAEKLSVYVDRDDVLVLALPRGGVPVAAEVAKRLKAPLAYSLYASFAFPTIWT